MILMAGLLAPFGWRNRRKMAVWVIGAMIGGGLMISACGSGSTATPTVEGSAKVAVADLKPNTTYYWKVSTVNADGATTDSAVRTFTTGN
jgi:hypothetical protein